MRRTYNAPALELLTFAIDGAIATTCANNVRQMGGTPHNDGNTCFIDNPNSIGGTLFALANESCTDVAVDYCYYTATNPIFAS